MQADDKLCAHLRLDGLSVIGFCQHLWLWHIPSSRRSHGHAVAFIEKCGRDVHLTGISKTLVAPTRSPAVANNEAAIGAIADKTDGVASANCVGLESIQQAMGGGCIVPSRIYIQADQ